MTRIKLSGVVLALAFTSAAFAQGAPVVNVGGAQSNESASQRLDRLERLLEARTQGQTAMMEQLGRLQRELSELRGMTEEHAFQLDQIVQRQRDIYQELDRLSQQIRSGGAGSGSGSGFAGSGAGGSGSGLAGAGGAGSGGSGAGGSGSVPTLPVQISDNVSENQAYDRAVRLVLQDRRYDQAIPEFQAFLQAYPNSSYAGNAHYWLGQLFYAQENYDEAVPHFQRVVNDFRDSNKRADCILKLGMIAQSRGNAGEARRLFEQVRSEYAGSTEAGMAARQLEQMR